MHKLVIILYLVSSKLICQTIAEAKSEAAKQNPSHIKVGYFSGPDKPLVAELMRSCNGNKNYNQMIDKLCEESRQKMSIIARGQKTDLRAARTPASNGVPNPQSRNYGKKYAVPPRISSW